MVAGRPARDAGLAEHRGRRDHRGRARHRRRRRAPRPGRLGDDGPRLQRFGPDGPAATILSIRVSLEFNDPLNSEAAIARKLPAAIAEGITYAVDHGARIIDLPLDPGTAGLTGRGNPAAAGGSQAEQAAVSYALSKNVLLVAPAGDDGQGPGLVNHPAAYAGVIAVGAVGRNGQVAPFSSSRSYVALTAPGVALVTAAPPDGYARLSSTSTSGGIVAGVAALILSRYPNLTAAQVTQALTGSTGTPASSTAGTERAGAPGAGRGTVDAGRAVDLAAAIVAASQPRPSASPSARPQRVAGLSTTSAHRASASALATSLLRYAVAGLGGLIVVLIGLLLFVRSRRGRAAAAADAGSARARPRGQHEQRRPDLGPGPGRPQPPGGPPPPAGPLPARPPATGGWPAAGGWQGGSVAEMQLSSDAPFRPAMAPAPKAAKTTARTPDAPGPPWAPASEPERTFGPLPGVANSAMPPDPGPGIRVPGDMTALPTVTPDMLPAPFGVTASPDPDFPPRPAVSGDPGADFPGRPNLMTRQSLGLAAAPVPADYAPPQAPDFTVPSRAAGFVLSADTVSPAGPVTPAAPAGPENGAARPGPSYIWDLAATDVFPAAVDPDPPTETPGPVPEDGEPGATAH